MSALPVVPTPVTIEEFERLEWPEDTDYELLEGEVLEVSHPDYLHSLIQQRIAELIRRSPVEGMTVVEMGYRIVTVPRHTKRSADVGYLALDRHNLALKERFVSGAPDLVVEILSPSNSGSSLNRLEKLCLANGSIEFWTVDPETRTIRIRAAGSHVVHVFEIDDTIPQNSVGIGPIVVSEVFAGILEDEVVAGNL